MKFHFQQAVRALILLVFSGLLFKLHFTSEITKFINPKYVGLSQSASIIFLILFFIQVTRIWTIKENHNHHCHHDNDSCHHDHGDSNFTMKKLISYLVIVFPLITGFLLPAKVLDASIADKKGGMAILSNQKQKSSEDKSLSNSEPIVENNINENIENPLNENLEDSISIGNHKELSKEEFEVLKQKLAQSSNIEMNDYVYSTYYDEINMDIRKFKGRKIELKGFVYKEEDLEHDQLVISRFLITHCVADAGIIGFLSEFSEAFALEKDTWIEANGVIDITTYNGMELPIIKITKWKKISEPKEPYLYPISVRIL